MGRAWWSASPSSPAWPGLLDVAGMARRVSRSLSRLWPSSLPDLSSHASSSSRWWWRRFDLQLGLAVLDSMLWPVVVAVESVALVSMLCFFFLFCGCSI
ncbi:hypothetical protein Taro_035110 [Colocasia esculenta]|uniref:Uncharacterized protein n=1 Tax=Colocasia esculenta TaxID=4460 RepID=A0A843WDW8_COLES|nr:hypothetical protein [Colocasia esculenta]